MTMNNEEKELLLDSARRWFSTHHSLETRLKTFQRGHIEQTGAWTELAAMGWLMLPLPERLGGVGAGRAECLELIQLAGRHLRPEPIELYMMLAPVLAQAMPDLSERLASGEVRFGVADLAPSLALSADHHPDGAIRLSGIGGAVLGGNFATHLLVFVRDETSQMRVAIVPADAPGLAIEKVRFVDSREAYLPIYTNVKARYLDSPETGINAQQVRDLAAAAMVADAAGALEAGFDLTLDYLKQRVQFGRPLSSQQAVQHKMADIFCDVKQMLALTERLGKEMDNPYDGPWPTLSIAKSFVGRRALRALGQLIQLSGGIGMTEEYKISHFYRRLHVAANLFGDAEEQLMRVNVSSVLGSS